MTREARMRMLDNPFYVLELDPECARAEVERAGQRILAMLELGLSGAQRYPTPAGPQPRDHAKVRAAMAELRDPQRRLLHELWLCAPTLEAAPTQPLEHDCGDPQENPGFADAPRALGWRR
ncbi:hypothetical protein G6O69_28095 [Pseudenhygromyxa sp. WMMC2535]|uniref:hypothetical protein n=1 Tax=Pseudenhygromyxa sp. WMMC2535 TaxID=2712867 RepID=UPI0015520F1C|nr:hypothetical protein [Pseudenhygromyxa sp. WMMC2535]NVB41728.1 hypothetical protein [Pseudenhygromyxa sp. WMMC2535]